MTRKTMSEWRKDALARPTPQVGDYGHFVLYPDTSEPLHKRRVVNHTTLLKIVDIRPAGWGRDPRSVHVQLRAVNGKYSPMVHVMYFEPVKTLNLQDFL